MKPRVLNPTTEASRLDCRNIVEKGILNKPIPARLYKIQHYAVGSGEPESGKILEKQLPRRSAESLQQQAKHKRRTHRTSKDPQPLK